MYVNTYALGKNIERLAVSRIINDEYVAQAVTGIEDMLALLPISFSTWHDAH